MHGLWDELREQFEREGLPFPSYDVRDFWMDEITEAHEDYVSLRDQWADLSMEGIGYGWENWVYDLFSSDTELGE